MKKTIMLKKITFVLLCCFLMGLIQKDAVFASSKISIVNQPKSVSGEVGSAMSMTVTAEGNGLKYQWEYYDVKSSSWKTYAGKTRATVSSPIKSDWGGLRLRCVVTDRDNNRAVSDEAVVTIIKALKITGQPKSVSGEVGSAMSMTVTAEGNGLKYQWEYYDVKSSSWKTYAGKTRATVSSPIKSDWGGLRLRCVVTDRDNNRAVSDEATINIIKREDWELPII